jgi:hypothetical protein
MPGKKYDTSSRDQRRVRVQQVIFALIAIGVILAMVLQSVVNF